MDHGLSYSGLTSEELTDLLQSIRAIASMPDIEAISALDRLIAGLRAHFEGDGSPDEMIWQRRRALDDIERLKAHIDRVRSGMLQQGASLLWDAQSLRTAADNCGSYLDPRLQGPLLPEIRILKEEAQALADEAEVLAHTGGLRELATRFIHSAASVRGIIADADAIATALRKHERYSSAHEQLWKQAKERAAHFRADKKLDEAEVAAAGGNQKKAGRLRREASVLLGQDWAQAFPSEPPPGTDDPMRTV